MEGSKLFKGSNFEVPTICEIEKWEARIFLVVVVVWVVVEAQGAVFVSSG